MTLDEWLSAFHRGDLDLSPAPREPSAFYLLGGFGSDMYSGRDDRFWRARFTVTKRRIEAC